MTDLRRDLERGEDIPLIADYAPPTRTRRTCGSRCSTGSTENEWSPGDRDVRPTSSRTARCRRWTGWPTACRGPSTTTTSRSADDFDSIWLPTQFPGQPDHGARRLALRPRHHGLPRRRRGPDDRGHQLLDDRGRPRPLRRVDWHVPPRPARPGLARTSSSSPTTCRRSSRHCRRRSPRTRRAGYEKASAAAGLVPRDRRFTYGLEGRGRQRQRRPASRFLSEGDGGRIGYCEQFASAMAVMARTLGIPARVAVGFLEPDQVGNDTWEYSSHDLHAWPELYFAGLRLGPVRAHAGAPGQRRPDYTTEEIADPNEPSGPSNSATDLLPSRGPTATAQPQRPRGRGGRPAGRGGRPVAAGGRRHRGRPGCSSPGCWSRGPCAAASRTRRLDAATGGRLGRAARHRDRPRVPGRPAGRPTRPATAWSTTSVPGRPGRRPTGPGTVRESPRRRSPRWTGSCCLERLATPGRPASRRRPACAPTLRPAWPRCTAAPRARPAPGGAGCPRSVVGRERTTRADHDVAAAERRAARWRRRPRGLTDALARPTSGGLSGPGPGSEAAARGGAASAPRCAP